MSNLALRLQRIRPIAHCHHIVGWDFGATVNYGSDSLTVGAGNGQHLDLLEVPTFSRGLIRSYCSSPDARGSRRLQVVKWWSELVSMVRAFPFYTSRKREPPLKIS